MMHKHALLAASLCCCMLLLGCGRGTRPTLGTVHGRVTLDGKPLAGAGVVFMPENKGRDSMGVTDSEGNYSLTYIRNDQGAAVGWHVIQITAGDPITGKPEPVPECYNLKTTLRREVKAGGNEINFDLTTGRNKN
jgi:hypothetical protein